MPVLEAWYDMIDLEAVIASIQDKETKRFYTKKLASATAQSAHEKEFTKLAFTAGESPIIIDQPPLIFHYGDARDKEFRENAVKAMTEYRITLSPEKRVLLDRYAIVDVAFKVVGVGSVGTVCGILLLMSGDGEPLFLQFKQARQSVLEPYAGSSPVQTPRAARRRRAAPDASRFRLLPRLDNRIWQAQVPLLYPPAQRCQDQARR